MGAHPSDVLAPLLSRKNTILKNSENEIVLRHVKLGIYFWETQQKFTKHFSKMDEYMLYVLRSGALSVYGTELVTLIICCFNRRQQNSRIHFYCRYL